MRTLKIVQKFKSGSRVIKKYDSLINDSEIIINKF